MSIPTTLTSASNTSSVIGQLLYLEPDPDNLDATGKPSRILLRIRGDKISTNIPGKTYFVSVVNSEVRNVLGREGILSIETLQLLLDGKALPDHVIQNIDKSRIRVRVSLDSGQSAPLGKQHVRGSQLTIEDASKLITAANYNRAGQSQPQSLPATWPEGEKTPPFTPIKALRRRDEVRIGYSVLKSPITYIQHSRISKLEEKPVMRQATTIKKGIGKAYESYNFQYVCSGPEEIQAGIVDVFDMVSLTPFITAEGGPFGDLYDRGDIPHHALAIRNFSISTVENMPNTLMVEIACDPFNWEWYTPPAEGRFPRYEMDDMLCWPLMKIWAKSRSRSTYKGRKLNGKVVFSFPDPEMNPVLDQLLSTPTTDLGATQDVNTLQSVRDGLLTGDFAKVTSRYAKEITTTGRNFGDNRYFVIKISDPAVYREFVAEKAQGHPSGRPSQYFVGLADWTQFEGFNLKNGDGKFIPASANVSLNLLNQLLTDGVTNNQSSLGGVIDIYPPSASRNTIAAQITQRVDSMKRDPNDASNLDWNNQMESLKQSQLKNPQDFYGIVVEVNEQNESEFSRTLTSLVNRFSTKANINYEPLSKKLRDIFQEDTLKTTILENGSDIVFEKISGTRGQNLAVTSTDHDPLPIHSFMGGVDATFVMEGKCFGLDAKQKLEAMKGEFEVRSLFKLKRKYVTQGKESSKSQELGAAFLKVDNEIFQLLGVDFVMPVTLNFQSVDGQPGVWDFSLTFIEYDPKIVASERVTFLPTTMDNLGKAYKYGLNFGTNMNPIVQRAIDYFSLQDSLSREEVYQDMYLPTMAELDFWISTLQKLGENHLVSLSPKNLAGKNRTKRSLSPAEKRIYDYVKEYVPIYYEEFSEWNSNQSIGYFMSEPATFVDPDFYCYYDPQQAFGNVFDYINTSLMGPRDGLHATGQLDENNVQSGFRMYDPEKSGISHVTKNNFWAANPEFTKETLEHTYNNAHPQAIADEVKKLQNQAETTFNEQPGKWWNATYQGVSTLDPNDQASVSMSPEDRAAAYQNNLEGRLNPQSTNPTPGELDYNKLAEGTTGEGLEYYLQLGWRAKFAKEMATQGIANPGPVDFHGLSHSPYFLLSPEALQNPIISRFTLTELQNYIKELFRLRVGPNSQGSSASEAILNSFLSFLVNLADYSNRFNPFYAVARDAASFMDLSISSSYIMRTGYINASYQYWSSRTRAEAQATIDLKAGSTEDRINGSMDYINWASAKNGVDANIVRAFFLRRDNLGGFVPEGSTSQRGFGDLDPNFSPNESITSRIDGFIALFKKNLERFGKVPSIALLAVNMVGLTEARNLYYDPATRDLRKEVINYLAARGEAIAKTQRFSADSARTIREVLNKYAVAGNIVDEYYTGYIHICRTFGSIFNPAIIKSTPYDAYFNPFGYAVLVDLDDNSGKFLTSDFSPTGNLVTVDLTRTEVDARLADIKRYAPNLNPNKSSLELQQKLAKKLRSAMQPHSEAAIYGSIYDLRKHSKFGRLVGAFPAYQILLINEGFYYQAGNTKLWDQFYTRTGVAEIEVTKTRHMPGSSATITFSNMFYNITAYAQMEALSHQMAVKNNKRFGAALSSPSAIGELFQALVLKNPSKELLKIWQNNHLKQLALNVGTRVQIRMGYGANAASLPVIFNGGVVDAPVQEGYVTLVCAGDGVELDKPSTKGLVQAGNSFAYQDVGNFGQGKDPSNIVTDALIGVSIWDNLTQGNFRDYSAGVAHFGEVYFTGLQYFPAEVQINIYSSSTTKIEQSIPAIRNFFDTAALYNWNGSNLFSVEVNEPSPWKVLEVCRRACLDHVASAEVFATRSTVFFGKWWWPYHYEYDESIVTLSNLGDIFQGVRQPVGYSNNKVPHRVSTSPDGTKNKHKNEVSVTPVPTREEGIIKRNADQINTMPDGVASIVTDYIRNNRLNVIVDQYTKRKLLEGWEHEALLSNWTRILIVESGGAFEVQKIIEGSPRGIPSTAYPPETKRGLDGNPIDQFGQKPSVDIKPNTPSGLPQPDMTPFKDVSDYLKDVQVLTQHLKWKTYMQAYIAHSGINLLSNNISASKEKVFTDAIGQHKYNGYMGSESLVRTISYCIDSDIEPTDRRTYVSDTGILLTGLQSGTKPITEALLKGLSYIPIFGSIADSWHKYTQASPTTPAIENAVVSDLVDKAKEMYQGWFVIMGQPTMKPRDLILLTDHVHDMRGPVFVKEVIHRMDAETGLITYVSPDAVVFPHSSILGEHLVTSLAAGVLHRLGAFMIFKAAAAAVGGGIKGHYGKKQALNKMGYLEDYNRILKGDTITTKRVPTATKFNVFPETSVGSLSDAQLEEYYDRLDTLLRERGVTGSDPILSDLELIEDEIKLRATNVDTPLPLQAELREFEEQLLKEQDELMKNKNILPGFSEKEREGAITRYINEKRISFAASKKTEIESVIRGLIDEPDVELLKGKIEKLISKEGLSRAEKAELNRLVTSLKNAVAEGRTTTLDVDVAIRKMVQQANLYMIEGDSVSYIGRIFREATQSIRTVIGGTVKIAGTAVERALGDLSRDIKDAQAEAASRKTMRGNKVWKMPSGKINLQLKSKEILDKVLGYTTGFGVDEWRNVEKGSEAAREQIATAKKLAKMRALRAVETAKDVYRGARLLKYMGPQAILSLAVDTTILLIGGSLIEGFNNRLKARQCVKILPLMVGSLPYTAGIRGHQGAVIGDDPSWADQLLHGWFTPEGVDSNWGPSRVASQGLGWLAALSGVEVPEYGTTEADRAYIKALQDDQKGAYGR
jgi:hypothetical protein